VAARFNRRNLAQSYPLALGLSIALVQVALGIVLFASFQEWVPRELDAGDAWGGYLLAMYGGARFVFETPAGALSDRIERRLGLLLGFALMVPALTLMAIVQDRHAFLVFAGMLGLATAFLWPAAYALSADLFEPGQRGRVVGFLNLAQLLGFGAGALIGVALVEFAGAFQFVVAAAAVSLAAGAAVRGIPNYRGGKLFRFLPPMPRERLRTVVSPRLVGLSAVVLGSSVGLAMVVPAIRPFGANELDVSFARLTLALLPAILVSAALYVPSGHLADRVGYWRLIIAGQVVVAAGLLACAETNSLLVAAVAATVVVSGNVLTVPALNAAVMDLAPESHRGALIGLMVALSGLGLALGPALGGYLAGESGAPAAFRAGAVVCVLTAVGGTLYATVFRTGRAS